MTDPLIVCPQCQFEIKLTESLAAPLVASARLEYERKLREKDAQALVRENAIREREEAVRRAQETVDAQVAERLRVDRARIALEESKKAKLAVSADFDLKTLEVAALQGTINEKNAKLAEAQKAQAAFLIKQRQFEDAQREMDLTIQRQVQESLGAVREKARAEAEESLALKVAEKDLRLSEKEQTINAMKKQLEEAQRKAEQGSQQAQGEALELQLEGILRAQFPRDTIEPVPKGEFGGDVLHRVTSPTGHACGTILWESKRTKNWSDGWLPKLRDDQRTAKAEVAILISHILPKSLETLGEMEGIWIADPKHAVPLAVVLRSSLIDLAAARQSSEGQGTKMQLVYQYLTGPVFRQRVQAIVEKFTDMSEDLDKERKAMTRLWSKREQQIHGVIEATAGMYGDLQGIAGRSLQEIEGLEFKLLDTQ